MDSLPPVSRIQEPAVCLTQWTAERVILSLGAVKVSKIRLCRGGTYNAQNDIHVQANVPQVGASLLTGTYKSLVELISFQEDDKFTAIITERIQEARTSLHIAGYLPIS